MTSVNNHLHIVLCREHYNPLGIIRSLGEAGIAPVAIILRGEKQFVGYSRYISDSIYVKDIDEAVEVLFNSFSNNELKPFLYITDDYFLEYIDIHYDDFKNSFFVANARTPGKIGYFMNKNNLNLLAAECELSVPKSIVVKKGEIPDNLHYPIITKAISSTSGAWKKDSFICRDKSELVAAYSKIKGNIILLQDFIDRKGEFCVDGISVNHGESIFLSMVTDSLYLIPGRYNTYLDVKNVTDNNLSNKIKKIIKTIGFEGIFDAEFMVGKDDIIYFLEINLRPNAFNYASTCAGMNDPLLWAKGMLVGFVDEDKEYRQIPKGFRAMVENTDFKDRVITKRVHFIKWLFDFIRCDCHFYFNLKDIKPFIYAFIIKKTRHSRNNNQTAL